MTKAYFLIAAIVQRIQAVDGILCFPIQVSFFDLYGVDKAIAGKFGSHFDIIIHLKDVTPPAAPIVTETFRMGCSPVVNLFTRMADPVYISQQKYEYQIIPDIHRQSSTEVYSIDGVFASDPRTNTTREFSPFYSLRHAYGEQMEKSYWYASRRGSQRPDDEGTEMFISLVDSNFDPLAPAVEVLNVRTTCTNRDLPARLPSVERTVILRSKAAPCLTREVPYERPKRSGRRRKALQWRLISHMNLNYLSIVNGEKGVPEALQEIRIYTISTIRPSPGNRSLALRASKQKRSFAR